MTKHLSNANFGHMLQTMTNAQLAKTLSARRHQWASIAEQTGVTYWTIRRLAEGMTKQPHRLTKGALVDYLQREAR